MPNPDRDLFFEHQGHPTQRTWQDGYSDLSAKIYRAFDRVKQSITRELLDPSSTHALVSAKQLGEPCVIDFRYARDFQLLLDQNVSLLVCIPPVLTLGSSQPKGRLMSVGLTIVQGGGFAISAWQGAVFIGPAPYGTPPTLSATAGTVNSLVARINTSSNVLRFIADESDEGFPL